MLLHALVKSHLRIANLMTTGDCADPLQGPARDAHGQLDLGARRRVRHRHGQPTLTLQHHHHRGRQVGI